MDSECTNASNVGGLSRAEHGILEQARAEALTLPGLSYGKPDKPHDWNRMPGEAFLESGRGILIGDLPHYESVMSDNSIAMQGNISLGRLNRLVLESVSHQKEIERRAATIKKLHGMTTVELFNAKLTQSVSRSKTLGSRSSFSMRGEGLVGASSAL